MSWAVFYLIVAGFITAVAATVYIPWARARDQHAVDQVRNAQIVKQRLAELDKEVDQGLISESDKQSAITELKLALVEESGSTNDRATGTAAAPLIIGFIVAMGIGGAVYSQSNYLSEVQQMVSARESIAELSQKLLAVVENGADISPQELQSLSLAIRQRLRETPTDTQAWLNLGRLYMSIGFAEQSLQAFERAFNLAPEDTAMRLNFAQALMLSGEEDNLQRAKRLLQFELKQQPNNDNIMLMLTVISSQLGQLSEAEGYFANIESKMSKDSAMYQSIVAELNALRGSGGETVQQRQSDSASSEAAREGMTGFQLTVTIANQFRDQIPTSGYLFVFARDADSEMRMPAAAVKLSLKNFPTSVTLSQNNAMMPNYSLQQLKRVELVARISMDDNVDVDVGEWQGTTVQTVSEGELIDVQIEINQEL
ncbi:c-type cytochrome biogenesis protein CcmI [Alteromonas oceanisediminis]|uniref:c-type cytochrome biogenesis protein CcmI n=1 Tax=Alteromonas oceanisediminis TaxID=2836180 RepID=UPI001BDA1440|nr:c-type cytochrome biogenesis protein CcmI [Alteromonas oceanisediminis]MBT0585069.1 c-type cytochrome biogenesis protein CcmI [Alteromonas oceanisediminis]